MTGPLDPRSRNLVAVTIALTLTVAGAIVVREQAEARVTAVGAVTPAVSEATREQPTNEQSARVQPAPPHSPSAGTSPQAVDVGSLPEARYDAVIAGLVPFAMSTVPAMAMTVWSLESDTAVYGADRRHPVARLSARDFLGNRAVIVPVRVASGWTLVLTPARQSLPSMTASIGSVGSAGSPGSPGSAGSTGGAPAQSAGWIRSSALVDPVVLRQRIEVSLSRQSLTVVDATGASDPRSFAVGVGTSSTPTPSGVTGYLQERYLDPAQGQSDWPVQLTSLHSSAADEPYGGSDGGLIGIHFERAATGAVSHGCIRLSGEAIAAVDALPLGTAVTIVD